MNSSNILIGPGYATFNSGNFRFGEGGIQAKFVKNLRDVTAEEFGRFDSVTTDRRIAVTGRLWSGWENLALIFPSAAFTPVIGGKLFGTAGLSLVIAGQDGSLMTILNAQITKVANLTLSVEKDLFGADVEFTGLLKVGNTPDQSGSYFTYTIGQSYTAPAFVKANFRAPVISAAWGAISGFTAFALKSGAAIDFKWDLDYEPCKVDGYGTMDAIVTGFEATCKGTPIGPTEAQAWANITQAAALGILESTNAADLTLTFGANTVMLRSAFIMDDEGFRWSRKNNRIGDLTWKTTVPFSSGLAVARAAVT
jgi:hypothetical protein